MSFAASCLSEREAMNKPTVLWQLFVALLLTYCAAVVEGATTTATTSSNETVAGVQSGTALYCYECSEKYTTKFNSSNAACLNNLAQITVRQCSPSDKYCQVQRETFDRFNSLVSISRGCVSKCPYGCYYQNYGATTIVCTSCCRSRGCNVGNSATAAQSWSTRSIRVTILLSLLLFITSTWLM